MHHYKYASGEIGNIAMLGMNMSFSLKKTSLFLSALCAFFLYSAGALADFPDLGVVGDHRLMTVVGFAQQDFYFDLFKFGGLQTLALTFALIGGLLILLIPKNHNFITIGCYLFLIFILIVSPNPSTDSLFFYPLDDDPSAWDCPIPTADKGLNMDILCQAGSVNQPTQAGRISDSLSSYAMGGANIDGFGAFVPQLVTIHFFTAVERTLLKALWANTQNATTPGDLVTVEFNKLASDTVNNNPNIQYYQQIYNQVCSQHSHLIGVVDFTDLSENDLLSAAQSTFTFADALKANLAYYGTYDESSIYPVRAATARLHPIDYTKSLTYTDASRRAVADAIRSKLSLDTELQAIRNYKRLRMDNSTTLKFPTGNSIFRALTYGQDYPGSVFGTSWPHRYEPDPYDYTIAQTGSPGAAVPTSAQNATAIPIVHPSAHWQESDLTYTPIPIEHLEDDVSEYKNALAGGNNDLNYELALAMADYPVQLYIPYVSKVLQRPTVGSLGGPNTGLYEPQPVTNKVYLGEPGSIPHPDSSLSLNINLEGLLPRTFNTVSNLGGIGPGANEVTPAVQSCLDFAALINSRRAFALEEVALIAGLDPRRSLTAQDLIDVYNNGLQRSNDADREMYGLILAQEAKEILQEAGCAKGDSGAWVNCTSSTMNDDLSKAFLQGACETWGYDCLKSAGGKIMDFLKGGKNVVTGKSNVGGFTGSPQGAVGYGGFNSYTAGAGDWLVKYGLMIASAVQGFVYGAYMKLMPVIISYGIAITLFMTPFVFLMGIAVPMQARSVLIAPVVAIAFLKTVSIALVVVDHAFVSLMFWVRRVNVSDPDIYEAMLIMAHLTASVSLFSLAGLLLFGLNDPGSFVKHLSSMDKAGQVSFQEAIAYGAAPIAAAGMAKRGIEKTAGMARAPFKAANEKIGQSSARQLEAGGLSEDEVTHKLDKAAEAATSTGIMGAVHSVTGAKTRAASLAAEMGRMGDQESLRDKLGDRYSAGGKKLREQKTELDKRAVSERIADNEVQLSDDANRLRELRRETATSELSEKVASAEASAALAPIRGVQSSQSRYNQAKSAGKKALVGIAEKDDQWKSKKGPPNTSSGSHPLGGAVDEMGSQFIGFANRNGMDYNEVTVKLVQAFDKASATMSPEEKAQTFKQGASLNEKHGFTAMKAATMQQIANEVFNAEDAEKFMKAMNKKLDDISGEYVVMDNTTGSTAEVTKLLKKHLT